jgi:hypothetical protein
MGEPQRFDLCEFGIFRESWQDATQTIQSFVQHVHSISLSVVRFHSPMFLQM